MLGMIGVYVGSDTMSPGVADSGKSATQLTPANKEQLVKALDELIEMEKANISLEEDKVYLATALVSL